MANMDCKGYVKFEEGGWLASLLWDLEIDFYLS